jgi:transcriptional regulator with XRE-family HTH domain
VVEVHTQSLRKLRAACQRKTRQDAHTQTAYSGQRPQREFAVQNKPVSNVARTLKRLREKAGISIPQMASELGMKRHSTYQHYEDRYKKDELPIDLAVRIAAILRKAGIADDELMELGTAARAHDDKLDAILAQLQQMQKRLDALTGAPSPDSDAK